MADDLRTRIAAVQAQHHHWDYAGALTCACGETFGLGVEAGWEAAVAGWAVHVADAVIRELPELSNTSPEWVATMPTEKGGCQHHRINNGNAQCIECGEMMIGVTHKAETIRTAPNAAGCNNPACIAALQSGSYNEANPPTGCTNPHGTYIPDIGRERTITVGWEVTYECSRCCNNGTLITRDRTEWDCGRSHHGDYISARRDSADD